MKLFMITLSLIFIAPRSFAQESPAVADVLPTQSIMVDAYTWGVEPGSDTAKVAFAIRKIAVEDPEWFKQHASVLSPDGTMRYSPRFGVSEELWNSYLKRAKNGESGLSLVPSGKGQLKVRKDGDSLVYSVAGSKFLEGGMVFNVKAQTFVIPFIGMTGGPEDFDSAQSPMGRLVGQQWKSETVINPVMEKMTAKIGKIIAMRLLDEPGVCALEFDFRKVVDAKMVMREMFLLKYPCPSSKRAATH